MLYSFYEYWQFDKLTAKHRTYSIEQWTILFWLIEYLEFKIDLQWTLPNSLLIFAAIKLLADRIWPPFLSTRNCHTQGRKRNIFFTTLKRGNCDARKGGQIRKWNCKMKENYDLRIWEGSIQANIIIFSQRPAWPDRPSPQCSKDFTKTHPDFSQY